MKADSITFLEFIGASKRTFYIPVYQRNYDWNEVQCKTLFQDIEALAKDPHRNNHFLGTLVYVEGESNAVFRAFTVIDGQQRLTTIMLLLKAIVDMTTDEDIRDDIIETYLTNRRAPETLRIKLKPMKSDADNFQKLIDGDVSVTSDSKIFRNYELFKRLIEESTLTPEQIYTGIQKLEMVYIELNEEAENPQLIFESLNSTGLDLTQADLIRNFLLMGQAYEKQEKLYNRYWMKLERLLPDTLISDYIRDYLTLKTGNIPKKEDVYASFKKYYRSLVNYDAEGFLEEITTYGEYYSWFRYCNGPEGKINERLIQLQKLKSTVVYPFLLSVFEDRYMYGSIDSDTVCSVMDIVLSFVMRRLLCEMPTNALNKIFATLSKEIEKVNGIGLEDKIVKVLASKKGKNSFPNDRFLKERLHIRDSYKFPHIKFVLAKVEALQSRENVDIDNLTIEHIMPQTLSTKWRIDLGRNASEIHEKNVHNIGNLTLTAYNSELSNSSFDDKKRIYQESNVIITRSICSQERWSDKEISDRADFIIGEICKAWPCPELINKTEPEIDFRTEFDFSDNVDVTGRTPAQIEMCGETMLVDTWRGFFKEVCSFLDRFDSQMLSSLVKHGDFAGLSKRIIAEASDGMRVPYKVAEGVYIELNVSANTALNYSKLLIEKFDDLESTCSFKLKAIQ